MLRLTPLSILLAAAVSGGAISCQSGAAEEEVQTIALFNGTDLSGWTSDVPAADGGADVEASFVVEDGVLLSRGVPQGHLVTEQSFSDYHLTVEYRWPATPKNCGVLVHASTPRRLYSMFPQSIECQLAHGSAGDFWCIGEDIRVDNEVARRGPEETWGGDEGQKRQIINLTDGSEHAPGEWNIMEIECKGDEIKVWVNGDLVNHGYDCTASSGKIALQAEGVPCEFRRIELRPLQ